MVPGLGSWPRGRLGEVGKTLKLGARPLDHLLQVDHKLGVHGIVGRSEGVQRCRAGGMENPEHAQLLKGGLVDSGVFLLAEGQNQLGHDGLRKLLGFKRCEVGDRPRREDLLAEEQDPFCLSTGLSV